MKKICNDRGFSLIEVLMALTIFATFMSAYVVSESANVGDSTTLRDELILHSIAESKINEIILNPPELRLALTLSKDTDAVEGNENYETITEWKQLKIPNLSQIRGEEGDDGNAAILKKVFTEMSKNVEKIIWQLSVTSRNKITEDQYTLSIWLMDHEAEINIKI